MRGNATMRLVTVEDLKEGDILANDVLLEDYTVVLGKGTVIKEPYIDVYDKETGKQIAHHKISEERGKYILDKSHRIQHPVGMSEQEKEILSYCNHDELAILWFNNLHKDKRRY